MSTDKVFLDFEMYSETDIKECGAEKYLTHPSTEPICLGIALNDDPVELWVPGLSLPISPKYIEAIKSGASVYAHNALFDFRCWNYLCAPRFGWPELRLEQMVDTMAICQYLSLPGSLDAAGNAIGAEVKKTSGQRLITYCCIPQKVKEKSKHVGYRKPSPLDARDAQHFRELYEYCMNDVDTMRAILKALPITKLPVIEQAIWVMTAEMNLRGLPVRDYEINAILEVINRAIEVGKGKLLKLTKGRLYSAGQFAAIKKYCADWGYEIENCQAPTVKGALKDPLLPKHLKAVLHVISLLGKTSTAKYKKFAAYMLLSSEDTYKVCDNLCYHGANTGRWAGRGVQPQNFPGAKVDNPDDLLNKFLNGGRMVDPIGESKKLLRAVIVAPKNKVIIAADYSSIENIVFSWLAGNEQSLQEFREGKKQYITMASALYGVPYDEIKEGNSRGDRRYVDLYKMGKALILGCQYGMGWRKFKETAANILNRDVPDEEAKGAVTAFREHYSINVRCWKELKDAAVRAILTNTCQGYRLISFKCREVNNQKWLIMRLPSGKGIFYLDPAIEERYIPGYKSLGPQATVTHVGLNSETRKWERQALIPGRITENAVQATSREIMAHGMLNVRERMPECSLIGTVHDEAIGLVEEGIAEDALAKFIKLLCDIPWIGNCPISAHGYISKRYKKD